LNRSKLFTNQIQNERTSPEQSIYVNGTGTGCPGHHLQRREK
jgi:hypothetical protein